MTQLLTEQHQMPTLRPFSASDLDNSDRSAEGLTTRLARSALFQLLGRLRAGQLTICDAREARVFGDDSEQDLRATLKVQDSTFYTQTILGGSLGAAESYLRGHWTCDDLTSLIRIVARNGNLFRQMDRGLGRIAKWAARIYHGLRANTRTGARRNIHDHYDLGNDFFGLFLDETMLYSSAVFENNEMDLEDASIAKMDRICRKLNLSPNDHLLEIGTGWGGLAEHAARNFGCRVTTTTISEEQFNFARRRIEQAGLSDRVTIVLQDYRDLSGTYDKLVSIEMIEAVGHQYFDIFFRKCGELLRPDGAMLLQAITMPDQRYRQYLRSVDFIQRYIFPGGCLPSMTAMNQSIATQTNLRMLHTEDLAPHYAQTLRCWRQRFWDQIDRVRALGFPERFIRMWHYYLCYCEAAFCERATGVVQMLLAQPGCRLDPVRSQQN